MMRELTWLIAVLEFRKSFYDTDATRFTHNLFQSTIGLPSSVSGLISLHFPLPIFPNHDNLKKKKTNLFQKNKKNLCQCGNPRL
jgi:hypothetical protein